MERNDLVSICRLVLDSVLDPKSAAYVAGPLDTGRTYFEALAAGAPVGQEIRKANEEKLTHFAKALRKRLSFPVIDPGPLRIPGWTGRDYSQFFLEVIEIFVKEVWFVEGWEFSSGATKEFSYCVKNDIKCLDEEGEIISLDSGSVKIGEAIRYVESIGGNAEKLRSHLP